MYPRRIQCIGVQATNDKFHIFKNRTDFPIGSPRCYEIQEIFGAVIGAPLASILNRYHNKPRKRQAEASIEAALIVHAESPNKRL